MKPILRQALPVLAVFLLAAASAARPARAQATTDLTKLQDEAVQRTTEYLRINTTDPPGNEIETARWFAHIFQQEGIPFDTASSAPGRGNIWARLESTSPNPQPALVLLHHMDVVPADPKYWDVDPFSATTRNGEIYGRGALDTKTLGIMELEAFLALHREHAPLDRDVIFLATADEEAGGTFGAGWVVKHHPEAFKGAGFVINEGGDGTIEDGKRSFSIEVTQKTPFWVKLTATGKPGHGSDPAPNTAVDRLIRALYDIHQHAFAPRVVPAVAAYMAAVAPSMPAKWRDAFRDPAALIHDPNALLELQIEQPGYAALLRNTCSITMLQGSNKVNVIPPEVSAQLDCRLLPDQDHDAFLRELAAVINDPEIRIEKVLDFSAAVSSTETPLYRAMTDVLREHFPDASVAPAVSTGFTDSHWFRDLGVASYGFAPVVIPAAEESGVHGNNERMSVENIRNGTAIMLELVRRMAEARVAGQ